MIWEEGKTPDFVLEVSSRRTYRNDLEDEKALYATVLEVKEYYIYDPEGKIQPNFIGYERIDGVYHEIDFVNSRLPSSVLGLELGERDGVLRLYDPRTREWLQSAPDRAEHTEFRARQEADARQNAEARAQNAEAELAQALAEIQRLRARTPH